MWVNLITDTLPALSLGVDPEDPDVMKENRDMRKKAYLVVAFLSLFSMGLSLDF
ncbi:cation transporting ATPase C-terminal domain-containing protein [Bacillus paranthracis]